MKKILPLILLVMFGMPGSFAQAEWAGPQEIDGVATSVSQLNNVNGEYICREGNEAYAAVTSETDANKLLATENDEVFVNVTYIVEDESGQTVFTAENEVIAGTVITELPDEFKRAFCTYSENSITVMEEVENVYKVTVSYNLPFVTSDHATGQFEWYMLNTADGVLAAYMDDDYDEYYVHPEDPDAANMAQQWAFSGLPYMGFKLYNRERAQYLLADDNTDNYCIFANEGTAWTIGENPEGMQLSSNGQNFYYSENDGFCMLGDATTIFSIENVPQSATVTYNIYDRFDDLVYTEVEENVQIGGVIDELPESAKRDFCTYEFEPLQVISGENVLNAKVTYNLPFNMDTYNYITVGDTAAVYGAYDSDEGYGFAGFEDARPVSGSFDITDINTWYRWPYTLEEQGIIHDYFGDTYDKKYGCSMALSAEYLWRIEGNPYVGFYLVIYEPDGDGNMQYLTDNDGVTDTEPLFWQLSSVNGGYAFKAGEDYLSAYYFEYQGKQYGYIGTAKEPTTFNFLTFDNSTFPQLVRDYDNAQEELNAYITDIKTVTTNSDGAKRIYDLQGCRMNQLCKGVNIVNSKKVLVK